MQHSIWHKVPVVRLLIAFASGIGTSMFYTFGEWVIPAVACISFLAFVFLPRVFHAYQHKWFSGIAVTLLFFCCGIYVNMEQNRKPADHFTSIKRPAFYAVMIGEEPVEKTRSWKMRVLVLQCTDSLKQQHPVSGNLLLYLGKQNGSRLPAYGDVLLIAANKVVDVPAPRNPGEFDYKRYLAFHYIYHQAYLKAEELVNTGTNTGNNIRKQIYSIQHFFTGVLRHYVKTPNEVGVAQALLYGFDDDIDEETVSAYANTGTLHVLAVSGMHVGLILWILNQLLFFMNRNKRLLLTKRIIVIVCIWAYSALCGLSPSILRATVMFSFIIVAQVANRRSNIYNTLAASCFVLLCTNTNMLANVGFQLSYMAVLGIVFLQPLIANWYTASTWLGRQVWSITSVSIAAQLATCPIGILYFHRFPNCFLFSNLLIIPLTTLIIYACILLLACSWWSLAAELTGIAVQQTILFTNKLVMLVEKIPYAYVNGLQISILQSITLYLLLLASVFYFMFREQWLFRFSLAALLYFVVLSGLSDVEQRTQKKLVIYSVSNSNAIHVISGRASKLIIDSNLRYDKQKFKFHLQQHIWQCGLQQVDTLNCTNEWQLLKAGNKTIVLSGAGSAAIQEQVHILVLRAHTNPEQIGELNPSLVVISGSVKKKTAARLEAYCRGKNIPVHNVLYSGAYQLIL